MACLRFVRVHNGLAQSGCTILYDPQRSVAPAIEAYRRYAQSTSLTRSPYDAVRNEYDSAKSSMPFDVMWTPNKDEKADPIKIGGGPFISRASGISRAACSGSLRNRWFSRSGKR